MIRPIALLLTVLTGFSGLVYEVAWQKYLATLLGSHSEATAAVLAHLPRRARGRLLRCSGASRGALVAARARARRGAPLLLALRRGRGRASASTRCCSRCSSRWRRRSPSALPHGGDGFGFAFDVLLSALLIVPPTVLMGGTIPILTQALSRAPRRRDALPRLGLRLQHRRRLRGALAGGFLLIPWLGLDGVLRAMGAVNLAAGAVFLALGAARDRRRSPRARRPPRPDAAPARFAGYARRRAARRLRDDVHPDDADPRRRPRLGSSHFTFAMVVAVFVLCIALGSFAVSALPRIPPLLLVGVAVAAGGSARRCSTSRSTNAPYWAHVVRSLFREHPGGLLPVPLPRVPRRSSRPARSRSGSRARCCRCSSTTCATRSATSAASRAGSTAGTRSARCSARCSAATRCCSGSISTTSTASRSRRSRWARASCSVLVLRLPRARGRAGGARRARRRSRCCPPGSRSALSSGLFRQRTALRRPSRGPTRSSTGRSCGTQVALPRRRSRRLDRGRDVLPTAKLALDHHQRQVRRRTSAATTPTMALAGAAAGAARRRPCARAS